MPRRRHNVGHDLQRHSTEDSAFYFAATQVLVHDASTDDAHPCVERALAAKASDGVDQLDEGELAKILVVEIVRAEQPANGTLDHAPSPVVQSAGSSRIAYSERAQQLSVIQGSDRVASVARLRFTGDQMQMIGCCGH